MSVPEREKLTHFTKFRIVDVVADSEMFSDWSAIKSDHNLPIKIQDVVNITTYFPLFVGNLQGELFVLWSDIPSDMKPISAMGNKNLSDSLRFRLIEVYISGG